MTSAKIPAWVRALDRKLDLFSVSNQKTLKSLQNGSGYLTLILHLAPANVSGVANMCPYATPQCESLNTAGMGGVFPSIIKARIRKTIELVDSPNTFKNRMLADIDKASHAAHANGLRLAVRPNGTSDLDWATIHPTMFTAFPDVKFYDYTKAPYKARKRARTVPNYHLTYSYAETDKNRRQARTWLNYGFNVAAVFPEQPTGPVKLPWLPILHPIDGDATDLRFADMRTGLVALSAKGKARRIKGIPAVPELTDESEFVNPIVYA
jgi:hypothetical protein